MIISDAPYFDICKTNPWDFVNQMNGIEQFFQQANFADNMKVGYAKLKLRGGAQNSICHHTFELSIYSNLNVVLFKLKQLR